MVVTKEVALPEESELTVNEVNLSAATLMAGSFHLGKYCEQANNVSNWSFTTTDPGVRHFSFIILFIYVRIIAEIDCITMQSEVMFR